MNASNNSFLNQKNKNSFDKYMQLAKEIDQENEQKSRNIQFSTLS